MLKINQIREVLKQCSFNTLGVFDLDNTVLRPTRVEDLGSDQWFSSLLKFLCETGCDATQALFYCVMLNDGIQEHIPVKSVEPNTKKIITILTDVGLPAIALTSRGPGLVDRTLDQLNNIDIKFTATLHPDEIKLDIGKTHRIASYRNGVIFCDGADKGTCLMAFLKMIKYNPKHVVMVDDIEKHLGCVQTVLEKAGIKFTGLHYTRLEQRVAQYNKERSHTFFATAIADKLPLKVAPIVEILKAKESANSLTSEIRVRN